MPEGIFNVSRPLRIKGSKFGMLKMGYGGVLSQQSPPLITGGRRECFERRKFDCQRRRGGASAFQALMASDRWKAIKWKDSGPRTSFTMREDWVKLEIGLQVPLIQEVKAGSDEPKGQK